VNTDELVEIVRSTSLTLQLDPALICAIIEQESNWKPWAIRYEPDFYLRYVLPNIPKEKICATEAHARAISWGLMQVMGEVAREAGFKGDSLAELCEPEAGVGIGCKVFAEKLARTNGDTRTALQQWNGGGNQMYAEEVLARTHEYTARAIEEPDVNEAGREAGCGGS